MGREKSKSKEPPLVLGFKGVRHVAYSVSQEIGNEYFWRGVCLGKERAHSQKKGFNADKLRY